MKAISIKVIDKNIRTVYGMPCCVGEIQIDSFTETFDMPLEWWTLQDYQKQWKEGLERIKFHNQSCLVTEVQDPTKAPRISFWPLYKKEDKVFVQNHLLFGRPLIKELKKRPFTIETCYDFVKPRETLSSDGITKVSEWVVRLEDII